MMPLRRRNTITVAAVIIYVYTTALFLNPTQVLADRDVHLQEKYFLNQLKNKKRGFLFGRKKKRNNDPAVQYQRQQHRLSDSAFLLIAMFLACLAVLWIFSVSTIEMAIVWIGAICSQISEFTGSFAQQRTNETSRRQRDRSNNISMPSRRKKRNSNNTQTSRQRNSYDDNQSISQSVLEIIDMETVIDDSPSSPGVISSIFGSMARVRKKFMSSSKRKVTPDDSQVDRSSSSRNQKSHRDKSSLRLRASSKQTSGRRDEELGDDDKSNVSLPGFLHFIEEDECSDNGTAFAINSPERPSPKRDKHAKPHTHASGSAPSKKMKASPLQKKISHGSDDVKKHRSHHHHSSHHHSSRRPKHRTSA
uniref:Uncharacterized protein n=1 Tax=Skeletonema marinoi TaxID=267567 RepID=A0A7S1CTD0_9STRA|mmetsp:Transcript_12103/g.18134  ORF Transcript_12103/g.18134 Transcript_12103/m.18134 type:complete len:363 (+) Transcript_12103:160-1248(+)